MGGGTVNMPALIKEIILEKPGLAPGFDLSLSAELPAGWYGRLCGAAQSAYRHAYAPYSGYLVGAAIMMPDGRIYAGCNVECVDYDGTHAEEAALAAMCMGEEAAVRPVWRVLVCIGVNTRSDIADWGLPCGKCRQKLIEFADDRSFVLAPARGEDAMRQWLRGSLLPEAFMPCDIA
jgi:cytidine deaminase